MSSPALNLAKSILYTPKGSTIDAEGLHDYMKNLMNEQKDFYEQKRKDSDATLLLLVEENKRLIDERESMMNSKVTMDEHAWAIVKNYRETIVKMDEDLTTLKDTLKKQNEQHMNAQKQFLKQHMDADEQITKLNNEMVDLKDAEIEKLKEKIIMDEKDYEMLDYYRTEAHEIAIFTDDEVRADDITTIIPYIKKLQEENKELKVKLSNTMMDKGKLAETIWELKEESRDTLNYWQSKCENAEAENKKLKEHYDRSIHIDWIAEAAGEDKEYYRDVCCADTLGKKIKENKELKETINKMAGSRFTTQFCFENWIVEDQIDPRLLMDNHTESYKQDENGKWIQN